MRALVIGFPKDLEPYIIGLWRFRVAGEPRLWCLTYAWRGRYYDTTGAKTPLDAYDQMRVGLARLRRRR